MIKKLLLGLIFLAVIAAAAVYFFGSAALNKGVKSGVETFGPRVTQTPVYLDTVNLSVFSGSGTLQGLRVGNPEGYKSENIFALGQIDMKVDTGSLLSDTIIIDHVIIQKPEISSEKRLTSSNLKQLLENIESFTGPAEPGAEVAADSGPKKNVVIKKLIIEDGTIYVGALGIGQTVPLPRIEMENIGEGSDDVTIAESIKLVINEVFKSIGPAIAGAAELSGAAVNAIKTQGLEKVGEASKKVGETTEKVSEGIKGLFGN
jgi:hypothetical protein